MSNVLQVGGFCYDFLEGQAYETVNKDTKQPVFLQCALEMGTWHEVTTIWSL